MENLTANTVKVKDTDLVVKEYSGQRVVTLKDIDTVHQRATGTAGRNFRKNRKHFIDEVDYFKITPDEFRRTIGYMDKRQRNDVILVTETGYLMLVKSFTDELAWAVQRELVKSYFRVRTQSQEIAVPKLEPKPEYVHVLQSTNAMNLISTMTNELVSLCTVINRLKRNNLPVNRYNSLLETLRIVAIDFTLHVGDLEKVECMKSVEFLNELYAKNKSMSG